MPPGSPPRGGESARLRPPGDPPPPSFGTFDGVARGGKSGDDTGSDDAGIFDTEDFAGGVDASPDAELEVEISLLEHGRSISVSHKVFSKPARPSAREVDRALRVQCGDDGLSIPGIHTPVHPASVAVRVWTGYMLLLTLTYVAFLEPIFIAFNTTLTNSRTTAVIDFISGAAFAFDLAVNFRTGLYYVCEGHVKLVLEPRIIASEYAARYFFVDLLAAVPFFAQLAYYGFVLATGAPPATHSLLVTAMRAFRLLRVVRLWKLFLSRRAMLGAEIFMVHQTGTPLIVFGATVVYWFAFLVNLMACSFIFAATSESFCDSWVAQLAVEPSALLSPRQLASLDTCGGALGEGMALPSGRDVYINAVYFATATLTTVGFGDLVAKTPAEKLVVVLFMLIGAFFIATFTGQMVAVLAKHGDAHAAEQAFKDKMVAADRFVKDNALPPAVGKQVLGWVQHAYMPHEARFSWKDDLLAELPVAVRAAAVRAMAGDAALRDALRGASAETLAWIVGRMTPRSLHTGHYLCLAGDEAEEVYVTASGALQLLAPAAGGRAAAVLPGRGHVIGGAAAARALAAEDDTGSPRRRADTGAAPPQPPRWPLSVQAAVESSLFALPHSALCSALRMGALAAPGRAAGEEAAAVFASLTRVDAMERTASLDGA